MLRRRSAVALVLALVAASCDSGPSGDDLQPRPGGELVVAVRDLGSLDPVKAAGRGALLVLDQVFDPLTAIDPDTNEVVAAAASEWTVSGDGLRWTFTVRGAYHDGSPVRARDFEFAFDRLARKTTESEASFQLEQIKGFREAHTLGSTSQLAGVRSVDAQTLEITLERPYAELPYALAHPALGPISYAKYFEAGPQDIETKPLGNGPFQVQRATPSREAVLVRNDAYTPTPYLDRVRITVAAGGDEAWSLFNRGRVDVADVPASSITTARGRFPDGFTPQWSTLSFGPNLRQSKYAKPEVRRAISLLIDRDAIASSIYGGTKDPATGILPRGIRGYVPDACTACGKDVARARQIIDAAFPTKPSIAIDHLSDDASRQVSRALANQLEVAGFRVSLRAHAPGDYLDLLQDGRHDFAQLGWIADVPSPDGFLAQQLRSGSPNNQTGFRDATFDRLIDRARSAKDEAARLQAYREAESRALELMPLIPVVFFRNRTAIAERVHGLLLTGAGLFDASTVWVAS